MKREKIQLTVNSGVSKEVLLQGTSHPLKEKVGKWYDGYAMLAVQSFCMKEEEVEWRLDDSKSGSDNIHDVPVDDQDPNQRPCKKRYHCHTQHQIQEMEAETRR